MIEATATSASPDQRADLVWRERCCRQVAAAGRAKLIVAQAPAGYGKTSMLAQIRSTLEQEGIVCAWLTLDAVDADASRFLYCLAMAIARIAPAQDERSEVELFGAPPPPGDVALELVDRLAACTEPYALFLDDIDAVATPANLALLELLIEHLPRNGQLFLASTGPLALDIAAMGRQALLLDADALAFSAAETQELLRLHQAEALADAELGVLLKKSGGSAALLALAATFLSRAGPPGDFIAALPHSPAASLPYLCRLLLDSKARPERDSLLHRSLLGEVEAPLCAGVLYATLAQERPEDLPRLHRAAAQWHENAGRPVPAIRHATAAGDFEQTLRLLTAEGERLLAQGRIALLHGLLSAVPEAQLAQQPLLQALLVWTTCHSDGAVAANALLARTNCADSRDPAVIAYLQALRPLLMLTLDRQAETLAAGRETVSHLPTARPYADNVIVSVMAQSFASAGQYHAARQLLDAARRRQGHCASIFNMMYSETLEGCIDLQQGRLRQAGARFSMALSAGRASTHGHCRGNALAAVLHAAVLYECDRCAEAERLLRVYLPLLDQVGPADHLLLGHLLLARSADAGGDATRADSILAGLAARAEQRQLPRLGASVRVERARRLLLRGQADAARRELEAGDDAALWAGVENLYLFGNDLDYAQMQRLRWQAYAGDAAAAIAGFEREIARVIGHSLHRRALKLRVLKSVAYERSGNRPAALDLIGLVLRSAGNEGFLRLIIDEGEPAAALVRMFASDWRGNSGTQRDPLFAEYLQRLLHGLNRAARPHRT